MAWESEKYKSLLDIMETELAIKLVKDSFERELALALELTRVSAPLFVKPGTGLNDDLNGVERPVSFDVPAIGEDVEIVQSLAKWKRMALKKYGFLPGTGLYTDMNAIRRDEIPDALHSIYVDQWDWEKVILPEERNVSFLKSTVRAIYEALRETELKLTQRFPQLKNFLPPEIHFITTNELLEEYPNLSPKERENEITKRYGAVFLMQIGGKLKNGEPHDGRAPDYDDWELNGDILIWYPVLECCVEISSMGIRVDSESLVKQLMLSGKENRLSLPFHKALVNGELPLTMGGGIGQSRICMLMLEKAHVGEVQSSVWPAELACQWENEGIHIL